MFQMFQEGRHWDVSANNQIREDGCRRLFLPVFHRFDDIHNNSSEDNENHFIRLRSI